MVRISLIAAAALVTIATLNPSVTANGSTVVIAERKAAPCADKSCAAKPLKRAYVGAAPLGW
jgi:hypothetical protein